MTGTGGKVTNSSGFDIIFSSSASCASTLNFEVQSYTASTGALTAWVQVPSLSAGSVIYMCYGNPSISTDQSNKTAVWDSNYQIVQHLDDSAATTVVADSTSNGNNGTAAANTSTKSTTGEIGNALNFNGSTDSVNDGDPSATNTTTGDMTLEMWVNRSSFSIDGAWETVTHGDGVDNGFQIFDNANGSSSTLRFLYFDPFGRSFSVSTATSLNANTWYDLAVTQHGAVTSWYVNGVLDSSSTNGNGAVGYEATSSPLLLMAPSHAPGKMDEFRFSNALRSASWLLTSYSNQSSPSTFYTVGSETVPPVVVTPSTLPNGAPGTPYSQTLTVSGGSGPYTWSVSSGTLPSGLTLDTTSTGSTTTISGTPTTPQTASFTVQAVATAGGTGSQAYSVTIAFTVSSPPQSLSGVSGNTKAFLSWSAPSFNGGTAISNYLVYDKMTGGGSFTLYATLPPSQTTETVTGLTNAQSYDFEVIAENSTGNSAPSNIVSVTPAVPTPAICYAVASGNWSSPSVWASTSGGTGGSCTAAGGVGLPVMGSTVFVLPGVPGAATNADLVVINSGVTVHIPAGLGIELSNNVYNGGIGDALTINGTNSTTYGALVIDNKALLEVHGASSSNDNFLNINQYGVLQTMPGGAFWIGSGANNPNLIVSGRFYSGCLDQTAYPTPFCAGNAGGWVTGSVGSTNNITAVSSLPAGLAVGDLVELNLPQSPTSVGYPYAINGVTPPPAPPVQPTTNDTGTSPMKTCGSVATCLIPESTPLCVVGISGSSVSLGWPQGGTTANPYCTGAETAINVTSAGSGQMWLNKPAFLWGDPSQFTWNNAVSQTITDTNSNSYLDATHTGLGIGSGPISNAAGTAW